MESIMSWVISALSGHVSREMIVFIISMVPILELRGGLLAASVLNINITRALWICIIGNIIPVPFILLLITPIFNWLKQTKTFRPMVEKMEARALSKREQVEKYEFWGLVLFVGIPLPGNRCMDRLSAGCTARHEIQKSISGGAAGNRTGISDHVHRVLWTAGSVDPLRTRNTYWLGNRHKA